MLQIRTFCRKVFYSFFPSLAIPQFGLLSHISSLRLSSGRSGSALPQRTDDAAGTSLSSPHLLVADASVWATSPWQLWLGTYSVGSFFFSPPRYVALWDSKTPHRPTCMRVSYCLETSPPPCREGNGNPVQCSCLENPRDGGAWWAAISGVAKSQTQLKWLSSSSSSSSSLLHDSLPRIGLHP